MFFKRISNHQIEASGLFLFHTTIYRIGKVPGADLDEYPSAIFKEGGSGVSVRPINPSDNRGAGPTLGHALRVFPDGTKVRIRIID